MNQFSKQPCLVTVFLCCSIAIGDEITFETIPLGKPLDGLIINDQFAESFGVVFSLEDGTDPVLAQVGAPQTAFQGYNFLPDQPAPNTNAGQFFLTDDGVVSGPPSPLIISYLTPVSAASGVLLDIDGTEGWTIQARDAAENVLDTVILGPNTQLDGSATIWSFLFPVAEIHSIRMEYTGTQTGGVGLAFDNFSPSSPIVLGDVNCDGVVDLLDVAPFVELISTGSFEPKADINQDGSVDLLDVAPFIELLIG